MKGLAPRILLRYGVPILAEEVEHHRQQLILNTPRGFVDITEQVSQLHLYKKL